MTEFFNSKLKDKPVLEMGSVKALNTGKKPMVDIGEMPGSWKVSSRSRGKEIMIDFDGPEKKSMLVHFKIAGYWKFDDIPPSEDEKYQKTGRMFFRTEEGYMKLLDHYKISDWKWSKGWGEDRGPDPVTEFDQFVEHMYRYKDWDYFDNPVVVVMMHQLFFNGVNNFSRTEILARTRFSPFTPLRQILKEKIFRDDLFENTRYVLQGIYEKGGSQFRVWRNPFGASKQPLKEWIIAYCRPENSMPVIVGKKYFWCLKRWEYELYLWLQNKDINNVWKKK
jgi:formamidopyrimidine-DNA glycosylase